MTFNLKISLFFLVSGYFLYLLTLLSIPYLAFEPGIEFLQTKKLIYPIHWWRISFYIHVFSSPVAFLLGILQFSKFLLEHYPRVHRIIGKMYVSIVLLLAAPSGLLIGLYANGGMATQISFVTLSILWIWSTWKLLRTAQMKQMSKHVTWNLRSMALLFSAVTLRAIIYLASVFRIDLPPHELYLWASWMSWTVNLAVVEFLIWLGWPSRLLRS